MYKARSRCLTTACGREGGGGVARSVAAQLSRPPHRRAIVTPTYTRDVRGVGLCTLDKSGNRCPQSVRSKPLGPRSLGLVSLLTLNGGAGCADSHHRPPGAVLGSLPPQAQTQRASPGTPPTPTVTPSCVPACGSLPSHLHTVSPRPATSERHPELCWLLGLPPRAARASPCHCHPPTLGPRPLPTSPASMALATLTGSPSDARAHTCVDTPTVPRHTSQTTLPGPTAAHPGTPSGEGGPSARPAHSQPAQEQGEERTQRNRTGQGETGQGREEGRGRGKGGTGKGKEAGCQSEDSSPLRWAPGSVQATEE